jgi:hypothetical protein
MMIYLADNAPLDMVDFLVRAGHPSADGTPFCLANI